MANKYPFIIYIYLLSLMLSLAHTNVLAEGKYDSLIDTALNQQQRESKKSRISDNKSYKISDLHFGFKPFAPLMNPQRLSGSESEKLLSNVKVFPTQVSDQVNLSFKLNKDSNVSIKVMDALGNEVTTLLSQRLTSGDQNNTFNIGNKLNQGFYFIRVVAGTETIVKRIEVL